MKKQSQRINAQKITKNEINSISEPLVIEEALQIKVNYRDFAMTMQTPGDERYLARGLLFGEGINVDPFIQFTLRDHAYGKTAEIQIQQTDNPPEPRQLRATAACGVCGKKNMDNVFDTLRPMTKTMTLHSHDINVYYQAVAEKQILFNETGGCHAAGIFNQHGDILCVFEDIGRHNAVDKAIGYLLEHERLNDAYTMTVSGRISYEIIQKCVMANIPILLSISAPSSLAVDYAKQAKVTLAAFCRDDRATIYSGAERIIVEKSALSK